MALQELFSARRLRRWVCRRCSNRKPVRNHVRKPPWWRHLTGPWRAGSGELAFYSVRSELKDRRAISIASWWSRTVP